ncbi:pyridoxal phosphate-dependent aminotransferase [Flavobacterium psychrophilum]|uniref:pyridoxal phosphate-dependent aminotransferase n=1 Tax=Flavobacterium psychrophilum TaxID=96345 RepID=UPI000B7C209A|nr:pyridoxal phosphate-dependent aminotransferase [Flavobacterium psychrophilum]MBF2023274.1 pyridoxal phosphate-dependent aminotransferase [Flavobacterium psychrophilum]MCB5983988.1 pyridoxal phosphate-dependent aminotransferase [Flavobacterium psychrophilum]MCB5994551.1 pyridoxal phosphate-dependent aminotransferase [Flavobacterium psychrophilum]MCB6006587.1 pyridoxal phosphate-dependent aminotransferase [Flavobacterium psychrophilum]MCB6019019.1 pyridoxal phosphate-dependent aminotransferas
MNNFLSDRINKLSTSQTLAMAALARELKNQGKDIISLSLGEPDFNTPNFIKEAAKKAIDENYSTYTPVEGYAALKDAICRKFKRDNNLEYKPANIVVSTGAKQSLYNIAQVMINDGDEVILPAPYWVSYYEIIKMSGGIPVEVPTSVESDFKITPVQLEAAITPKTKMIWYSSPCNPSGSVYNREELTALAKVLEKHPNIFIVSDEIYEHINFSGTFCSIASIPGMFDRTITVNGVAKAFAMTGWRIGYIGAPEFIAKACTKMQGQVTSGANSIAQRATIAAVDADPSVLNEMVTAFKSRRDLVVGLIKEIPGLKLNTPEGAFYVFPDVSAYFGKTLRGKTINNADDFSMYLLGEANVATVTGDAFGNPNCIRISYATSEEILTEAIRRIKEVLA